MIGGVVEEVTRKGKVSSSNPTSREARDFTRKKARLQMELMKPTLATQPTFVSHVGRHPQLHLKRRTCSKKTWGKWENA